MGATGSPVPEAGSQATRNSELGASLSREIGRAAREPTESTGAPGVSAIRSVMVSGPAGDTWTRSAEVPAACHVVHQDTDHNYGATVRALSDVTLLALPSKEFSVEFRRWFPMATHLLEGMYLGWRNSDTVIGSRRRLLALGELSAGLTHELNNPAAAAVRATSALRERVAGMRHKLAFLAKKDIEPELLYQLIDVQERPVKQVV